MIELVDKILLYSGKYIVDEEYAVDVLLKKGSLEGYIVDSCTSVEYDQFYEEGVTDHINDVPHPRYYINSSLEDVIQHAIDNNRGSHPEEKHLNRLYSEIEFFIKNGYDDFLISLFEAFNKMKEDDLLWCSRGSASASYLLFCLDIHDVDALEYDIPFSEFSKEDYYDR